MQSEGLETKSGIRSFVAVPLPLAQEEQARADTYGLIARLLLAPPDDALLASLAGAGADTGFGASGSPDSDQPLERAWLGLSLAARQIPGAAVRDEFSELFISTSIPKINPYGSLYLAGFLHEKPLAALRTDLAHLGLARRAGALETEDHLGALCETMRRMILGGQGACLEHLRQADGARFYGVLADFVAAYFDIERAAFDVASDFAPD